MKYMEEIGNGQEIIYTMVETQGRVPVSAGSALPALMRQSMKGGYRNEKKAGIYRAWFMGQVYDGRIEHDAGRAGRKPERGIGILNGHFYG